MVNRPLTIKMLRDLWQRRGSILALVMILAVGVCCYIGMAGVYRDLDDARIGYYNKYNLADFTLDLKRSPTAATANLNALPNILRLRTRIKQNTMVTLPNQTKLIPGEILSLPVPKHNMLNNVRMVHGSWFSGPYSYETIVDQQFATARHLQIGDTIKVRLPAETIKLLIVGTVTSPEFVSILPPGGFAPDPGGYAITYMPFNLLQQYSDLNGSFNQLLGMTRNKSRVAIKNSMDLLERKLDNYGVLLKTAQHDQLSVNIIHDELINIEKTTTVLPTMFFLVAILVLNVMLARLIMQQRNLIGTLKALGYSNRAILRHYLGFGAIIGLLGGIVGIILGHILQQLLLSGYKTFFSIPHMSSHLYPSIIAIGIALSIVSAFLGTIIGCRKALKLSPAQAMRPPTPEKGVHIILERINILWKRLSFRGKMIARSIFRNKTRSLVTIAASILATALVFVAFEFVDSMYEMIDFSFTTIQHQDYTVVLRDPLGEDILRTAASLPGVAKLEGQLLIASTLKHGPFHKNMSITGIPSNNVLYTPVDQSGRKVRIPKAGLVINETLAKILHATVGKEITIRPLLGERKITKVPIVKIIHTYLGLSAYANQTWLSRLMGDSYVTNQLLFKLYNNANKHIFLQRLYKFAPVINVTSKTSSKHLITETFDKFMIFAAIVLILFAAIIAIGSVINTAIISLNERERDVASLRLIGFTVPQTAMIFFTESLILNCIGIFLGIFMGIYFAYYTSTAFSSDLFRLPMIIKGTRIFETVLLMLFFVIISQAIVYLVIKKIKWFAVLQTNE